MKTIKKERTSKKSTIIDDCVGSEDLKTRIDRMINEFFENEELNDDKFQEIVHFIVENFDEKFRNRISSTILAKIKIKHKEVNPLFINTLLSLGATENANNCKVITRKKRRQNNKATINNTKGNSSTFEYESSSLSDDNSSSDDNNKSIKINESNEALSPFPSLKDTTSGSYSDSDSDIADEFLLTPLLSTNSAATLLLEETCHNDSIGLTVPLSTNPTATPVEETCHSAPIELTAASTESALKNTGGTEEAIPTIHKSSEEPEIAHNEDGNGADNGIGSDAYDDKPFDNFERERLQKEAYAYTESHSETKRRTNLNLLWAAKEGCLLTLIDVLKREQVVDVNTADKSGKTALHYACMSGNQAMIRVLIAKGASVDLKDQKGKVPFNYLTKEGINAKNSNGETLLHVACSTKNKKMILSLLDNNADTTIKDVTGRQPYDYLSPIERKAMTRRYVLTAFLGKLRCRFFSAPPIKSKIPNANVQNQQRKQSKEDDTYSKVRNEEHQQQKENFLSSPENTTGLM